MIGSAKYKAPEILFNPERKFYYNIKQTNSCLILCVFLTVYMTVKTYLTLVIGSEEIGVHELLFNSIRKSDLDLRKTLYQNIVLSGGSTLFKGKIKIGEKTLSFDPSDRRWAPTCI